MKKLLAVKLSILVLSLGVSAANAQSRGCDVKADIEARAKVFVEGDVNQDSRMSKTEFEDFKDARFDMIDLNEDGVISKSEKKKSRKSIMIAQFMISGMSRVDAMVTTRKSLAELAGVEGCDRMELRLSDFNGDGEISKDEFDLAASRDFKKRDRNRDGVILLVEIAGPGLY